MGDNPVDLAQVQQLQQQLVDLKSKLSKVGGPQGKKAEEILAEVARLATEVAKAGGSVVQDREQHKKDLQNQAKRVQDLIRRLGATRG